MNKDEITTALRGVMRHEPWINELTKDGIVSGFAIVEIDALAAWFARLVHKKSGVPVAPEHAMKGFQQRPKMDSESLVAGACVCGYVTPSGDVHFAFKTIRNHVMDSL